jgi:hypothetical protein
MARTCPPSRTAEPPDRPSLRPATVKQPMGEVDHRHALRRDRRPTAALTASCGRRSLGSKEHQDRTGPVGSRDQTPFAVCVHRTSLS